jgi:hypothetical protein
MCGIRRTLNLDHVAQFRRACLLVGQNRPRFQQRAALPFHAANQECIPVRSLCDRRITMVVVRRFDLGWKPDARPAGAFPSTNPAADRFIGGRTPGVGGTERGSCFMPALVRQFGGTLADLLTRTRVQHPLSPLSARSSADADNQRMVTVGPLIEPKPCVNVPSPSRGAWACDNKVRRGPRRRHLPLSLRLSPQRRDQ